MKSSGPPEYRLFPRDRSVRASLGRRPPAASYILAGLALAASGTSSRAQELAPPRTPTPTPTPAVRPFLQAEAIWQGAADVDVQLIDPSSQAVGQVLPSGCESVASRTERVVFQGRSLPAGTYQVRLTGKSCPGGGNRPVATLVNVESEFGPHGGCQNVLANVPVGGTITACTFTVP